MQRLPSQIDAHTYFSVDIFDTMLFRYTKSPIDLFAAMSHFEQVRAVTSDFLDNRVAAENLARQDAARVNAEDVTLAEIYTCFMHVTKCNAAQADEIRNLELATELEFLHPTKFAKLFLDHLQSTKKRYILTSDMYLPQDALERILTAKGITGWERLLVSCEMGRTKHHGTLYKDVIEHFGVPPKDILHIGDNKYADGKQSEKAGLTPLVINASKDISARSVKPRKQSYLLRGEAPLSQMFIADYLETHHAGRDTLDFRELSDDSYMEAFGALIVAPLMTSLMIWMKAHLDHKEIKQVMFLARDGMFPKAVFELLYPEGFETRYVAASRRVLTIPFTVMEPDTVKGMFDATLSGCTTLEEFLKNIAAAPELAAHLEAKGASLTEPLTRKSRKTILSILADDPDFLMNTFRPEREVTTEYFKEHFPAGQKTALFDVGWRGSLQRAISQIIDPDADVTGFYFGTGWSAIEILQRNGMIYESYACSNGTPGYKSDRIEQFRDLIEFLCSADHGSVLRILRDENGEFELDLATVQELEVKNLETAAQIQNAALGAITSVLKKIPIETLSKYASSDDVEDFWTFVLDPQRSDALRFKDVRIFAGVGDTVGESLTRIGDSRSHYKNLKKSRWRQAYGAHLGKFTKLWLNPVLKARKRKKV